MMVRILQYSPTSNIGTSSPPKSAGRSSNIGYDIDMRMRSRVQGQPSIAMLMRTTVKSAKIAFNKVVQSVSELLFSATKWDETLNYSVNL